MGTANALLTGDRPDSIVIRARADFRKGSFETHLIVALALLEAGRQVVMSPRAMTLKAVLDWTLKGRDGLMWLVKKLKGRPPKKVTVTDDGEFLDVETEDTTPCARIVVAFFDAGTSGGEEATTQ